MTIDLTRDEIALLVAVLVYAEDTAVVENQRQMVNALAALRVWRAALLRAYFVAKADDQIHRTPHTTPSVF